MNRRSVDVVSATMRRVRSRDTSPEKALRRLLWARGLRYRVHSKDLPGHPDIIFPSARVAVFVDGDFWHGNQWRLRGLASLEEQFEGIANASYWIPKIKRTIARDLEANKSLTEMGWIVVRCWESEMRVDIESCVSRVVSAVRGAKG